MLDLKTKAKIYQYTGMYLAQKEEDAFMKKSFPRLKNQDRLDIEIGSWQAHNGFHSLMSKYHDKAVLNSFAENLYKARYYAILNRLWIIKEQLKWDLNLFGGK